MNTTRPDLLEKLRADLDDTAAFQGAYSKGLTAANVLDAQANVWRPANSRTRARKQGRG